MSTTPIESARNLCRRAEEKLISSGAADPLTLTFDETQRMLHELQIHQIELEMQNEELQQTTRGLQIINNTLEEQIADRTKKLFVVINKLQQENTDRKQSVKLLEQNRELLVNLANQVPGVIYQYRLYADGRSAFPYSSPGMNDIYEVTPEEVQEDATPVFGRLHPDDYGNVASSIQESARTLQTFFCEFRVILPRQGLRWRWSQAQPERMPDGGTLWHGIILDITNRKVAEEALQEREKELRLLAEAMPQIVWVTRPDGWNIYFNQQWVDYTGLTLEESCGHGWSKPFHPDDRQRALDAWQHAVTQNAIYELECRLRRADGAYKWWLIRGVPLRDESGTVLKWFGTCTDIDDFKKAEEERRELEQQLIFAQKLESLGVLSGGIAHDFNNILAIIIGHCSLAGKNYEKAVDHIPEIEKAANRAAALCRQMLAYAGKAHIVQSRVNMVTLVDEMVRMLKATTNQNAAIIFESSSDIPFVSGDAGQISQIAMNLIINASEAIGEAQGEIRVLLTKTTINADQHVMDHQGKSILPGSFACLEVTDNGCGMDNETRKRIFEPFYTTKFTGRGLGMSAVLGIIMSHGGALQLFTESGQGSTFKVYLPVPAIESAEDGSTRHVTPVTWQGSGTILLVEDDEQVKSIADAMLTLLGFTVIGASNGKEALELYQENNADITLVLTDVGMPVMNGYELFRELKKRNPGLPIIISSGFCDVDITSKIACGEIAGMLNKPYSFDQLQAVLKRVMEDVHQSRT